MDDSCAVCAENLEWVAYGPCGHREVCSTCVVRLRFICNDRRCCICKTESNTVFVTKALGDYTRMINDFSLLPSGPREGQMNSYWYHEDSQAFFDDLDQYKMVEAMCRLSCSVCDQIETQPMDNDRKKCRYKSIQQLKGHLFHKHRLVMCSLCLEGRKIFICEQKLYTRSQLNEHVETGAEIDGDEAGRDGFTGHPVCHFCRTPFYGDNELYLHMTTDHYTCHVCQRRNPGQYEYYKNYDDLEIHFRHDHFLCEDEACLMKKFIVFPSESELKRHNALEHGGRMSRSQRNAALRIPVSFHYRRSDGQVRRRGRSPPVSSDVHPSAAIEASMQAASLSEPPLRAPEPLVQPYEPASESSSFYLQAASSSRNHQRLQQSHFPPLPAVPPREKPEPKSPSLTMASRLRQRTTTTVATVAAAASPLPATSNGWPTLGSRTLPPDGPAVEEANRSLVERVRAAVGFDEAKYAAFRNVSGKFRKGLLGPEEYLTRVHEYGLSHLVSDLARLLPDGERRRELIEVCRTNGVSLSSFPDAEAEAVLSKVGYRDSKGKSKDIAVAECSSSASAAGSGRRAKKTSKFHRSRLGDAGFPVSGGGGSVARSPPHAAWTDDGGRRLFAARGSSSARS